MKIDDATQEAALISCFQDVFKLFGMGQKKKPVNNFDGSVDGILLLPVRGIGRNLLLHHEKMVPRSFNDRRAKLSKARKQSRKQRIN